MHRSAAAHLGAADLVGVPDKQACFDFGSSKDSFGLQPLHADTLATSRRVWHQRPLALVLHKARATEVGALRTTAATGRHRRDRGCKNTGRSLSRALFQRPFFSDAARPRHGRNPLELSRRWSSAATSHGLPRLYPACCVIWYPPGLDGHFLRPLVATTRSFFSHCLPSMVRVPCKTNTTSCRRPSDLSARLYFCIKSLRPPTAPCHIHADAAR